jgi:soluble lytic murein transglycosylase
VTRKRRRGIFHGLAALLLLGTIAVAGVRPILTWYFPLKYRESVEKNAHLYQIDPLLITAIMRVESSFDRYAISSKGARGLMQLMPETARWAADLMGLKDFELEQLFDPEVNIAIGVWYLSNLREQFDGDMVLALAAYNGGRANVLRWLREEAWSGEVETVHDIPFPETRGYVQKVLNTYQWYRRVYRNAWFGER